MKFFDIFHDKISLLNIYSKLEEVEFRIDFYVMHYYTTDITIKQMFNRLRKNQKQSYFNMSRNFAEKGKIAGLSVEEVTACCGK